MGKTLLLTRLTRSEKAAYGLLSVIDKDLIVFNCRTIENLSRLCADGVYGIKFEWSPRFEMNLWELKGVPGRSEIKIHIANYWEQLEGCVGVGQNHQDIDGDGDIDLGASALALRAFHNAMKEISESEIRIVTV